MMSDWCAPKREAVDAGLDVQPDQATSWKALKDSNAKAISTASNEPVSACQAAGSASHIFYEGKAVHAVSKQAVTSKHCD
jgi:hypothetical protein